MAHPEVTIDYTSASSADTISFTSINPARTIVCYGAGSIVMLDTTGTAGATRTYTVTGGETIAGEWQAFTSTTCSRLRMSSSSQQPGAPLAVTVSSPVRTGASGAQTNATATMANLADLTVSLAAAQKVSGTVTIFANNSAGAEGLKFDLNGGTATFTSIEFGFEATPVGATVGTAASTAIGTAVTATAVATTDACYRIVFAGVVNAAGTLIPRFAEVSHTSGTATVQINSTLAVATTAN